MLHGPPGKRALSERLPFKTFHSAFFCVGEIFRRRRQRRPVQGNDESSWGWTPGFRPQATPPSSHGTLWPQERERGVVFQECGRVSAIDEKDELRPLWAQAGVRTGRKHTWCLVPETEQTSYSPSGPFGGACVGPSQVGQQHRWGWMSTK